MEKKPFRIRKKAPAGYFTIQETADYLKVSTKTVRRYIKERGLPANKPAGIYLINREQLENWIRQNG